MKGKVYLVGAGPGDPELLTVKGQRLLKRCDAIVYDYLVDDRLLEEVSEEAERYDVGKRPGRHSVAQEEIERLIVRLAKAGKTVVRLKGGDPFLFGRGGEEVRRLRESKIPYEIVPGVTAALGCAAYVDTPLTHREITSSVTFLSGHEQPDKEVQSIDWRKHAETESTLVIYMGMGRLEALAIAVHIKHIHIKTALQAALMQGHLTEW